MALSVIEGMSTDWKPDQYSDDYTQKLRQVIEEKIAHQGQAGAKPVTRKPTSQVIDLVKVLQESLSQTKANGKKTPQRKAS